MTRVVIAGAGHNGLVAATLLARAGLDVHVLEARDVLGGAVRTEHPFPNAPGLGASTGAYLLGLMPPELVDLLGLDLPILRRDPHYFLPTLGDEFLLFGSDRAEVKRQFLSFFSPGDWEADQALHRELAMLREDLAPTWLQQPLSIEETADAFLRPELRDTFVALCRGTAADYLDRFGFQSDLLKAMYAVTDGFSGLTGGWDTPGTGMNFLIHNMCRLPGADGTWMILRGGMGTLTSLLERAATAAGATISTSSPVREVLLDGARVCGVRTDDGAHHPCDALVFNADPFTMTDLLGDHLPAPYRARVDDLRRDGHTLKVNLALKGLPKFTCLPEDRGQHATTIHILPQEDPIEALRRAFRDAQEGRLPDFPLSGTSTPPWTPPCRTTPDTTTRPSSCSGCPTPSRAPPGIEKPTPTSTTSSPSATGSPRAPRTWSSTPSPSTPGLSKTTSACTAATSTTWTTPSGSPTASPTRSPSTASTPAAPAATPPAA